MLGPSISDYDPRADVRASETSEFLGPWTPLWISRRNLGECENYEPFVGTMVILTTYGQTALADAALRC
jgi:hypothetical protein